MAKNLYVRVKPKGPVTEFHRCGIKHTLLWALLTDLDDATAERLQTEQMLETSEDKPEGFDEQGTGPVDNVGGETGLKPDAENGLLGSSLLPSVIKYAGGFEISLGELVQQVHAASGLSVSDWNGLAEQARETLLQVFVDQSNLHYELESALDAKAELLGELKNALEAKTAEAAALTDQVAALQAQLAASTAPAPKAAAKTKAK